MINEATVRYGKIICYVVWTVECIVAAVFAIIYGYYGRIEMLLFAIGAVLVMMTMFRISKYISSKNTYFMLVFYIASTLLAFSFAIKTSSLVTLMMIFCIQWLTVVFFFNTKSCYELAVLQTATLIAILADSMYGSKSNVLNARSTAISIVCILVCGWISTRLIGILIEQNNQNRNQKQSLDDLLQVVEAVCDDVTDASDDKADFISEMTNVIDYSLKSMQSMNEMIGKESDIKKIREYSSRIALAETNLRRLVEEIIIYNDIEQNTIDIVENSFNFGKMLEKVFLNYANQIISKKLSISFEIGDDVPMIIVSDMVQMERIIRILLSNAINYTDRGGIRVKIYTGDEHDAGRFGLCIDVEDTGRGIRSRDIERITDPFYRIDEYNSQYKSNSGLGLFIASRLATLINGSISVASEYGKGTNFHFETIVKMQSDKDVEGSLRDYMEKAVNDFSNSKDKQRDINIKQSKEENIVQAVEHEDNLPDIPGIDWDVARTYLPGKKVIIATLGELHKTGYDNAKQLREFYEKCINQDENALELYRIKVHAIKGNLKMIGAVELSDRAKELEYAARDNELDLISKKTSKFIDDYIDLIIGVSKIPEIAGQNNIIKQGYDKNDVLMKLDVIKDAMENFDTDLADDTMKSLEGYDYPESVTPLIKKMSGMVFNLDSDGVSRICEEIKAKL